MSTQNVIHYTRIADAIDYIRKNFQTQPSLEEIAEQVHLSPSRLQHLFTEWAGISPKKFLQYTSLEYAKRVLKEGRTTLSDATFETGLSGTGRLHDLFVNIEGMTPGEYKNGAAGLSINYSFRDTPFGQLLIASTAKGICYMAFGEDGEAVLSELKAIFPQAKYHQSEDAVQDSALFIFRQDWTEPHQIKLHLKGTDFQLKVWDALLKIPMGEMVSYGDLAEYVGNPKASRAVGTAVGDNPVSFVVPCHRVIRSSGELGGYHWGLTRKVAMMGWEGARVHATAE